MTLFDIAAFVGAIPLVLLVAIIALRPIDEKPKGVWVIPAIICVLFFGWSVFAIVTEGPMGFWTEHTRNAWGNQIWFDLVIGILTAWFFIVPRARAAGMKPLAWMVIILGTGCIGLSAMVTRLFFLEEKRQHGLHT
jgi:ABC-type thiamin/hydroxymethylpyrimidine transport system permease subunit